MYNLGFRKILHRVPLFPAFERRATFTLSINRIFTWLQFTIPLSIVMSMADAQLMRASALGVSLEPPQQEGRFIIIRHLRINSIRAFLFIIAMSFNGRGRTSLSLQGFKFLPSCSSVARCSDYKNSLCFFWCWQIYKNHQESATKFGQKCLRLPTGLNYK